MKYQEMLDFCNEKHVYASQFYIAQELEFQLEEVAEVEYSAERFEQLCDCAHATYLKSDDNNMFAICKAIAKLEARHVKEGAQDPCEMDRYDILYEAAFC